MQNNDITHLKKNDTPDEIKTTALSEINSVIMTPDQIDHILRAPGGSKKFSKIILRFSSSTLLTASPTFDLIGYPARKHKDYGSDTGATTYRLLPSKKNTPFTLEDGQEYIFGNNEITTDELEILAKKPGGGFYHLLFIPDKDYTYYNYQIFYHVQRCDAEGTVITLTDPGILAVSDTKPSPPAPPDPNI